ncbi:hypothetical protein [Aquimarina muelleri]|nr:hypothetical protein [Aquimarina muelleri]MCX2763429.1 hypothetical protein [Aquimarina muelleri]
MKSIKKDSSYSIIAHPMNVYEGVYKNDKPYQGYFKDGDQELFTVDYYEDGIKKYNYSFDVLQMLKENKFDGNSRIELNKKSIYKNEKIFDGVKYHYIKDGILVEQYKDGKHTGFYVDVFAVHYYNRLIFKLEKDTLEILSIRNEEYSIKLLSKNNFISTELYKKDSVLARSQNIEPNTSKFPVNSTIRIYKEDGIIKGRSYKNNDESDLMYQEAREIMEIFNRLEAYNLNNLLDIFNTLLKDMVSNNNSRDIERNTTENTMIIGGFVSDQDGKIKDGIRFLGSQKDSYYQIFKNNKILKEEKATLENFQEIFSTYMEKKYNSED